MTLSPRLGAAALSLLLAAGAASAHEDTPLRIDADGALAGLPAEFAPARLRLAFASVEGTRRVSALSLELRGARVELPRCILELLNTDNPADLRASASWYHDEAVVPHYLQLKLLDPGHDPQAAANSGFSLLFNLRSGRLMEMDVDVVRKGAQKAQPIPVDLRARCAAEDLKGVVPPAW